MRKLPILLGVVAVALAAAPSAHALILTGASVTNDFFSGTGVDNTNFSVERAQGVELALRAKVRFPAPLNVTNNDGTTNVYGPFEAAGYGTLGTRASWNFDWSINVNYDGTNPGLSLSGLTYLLELDYDPNALTDFHSWDPINNPLAVNSIDHDFGSNATTDSTGENDGDETKGTAVNYLSLITNPAFNIAQNSGNLDFFNEFFPVGFDPNLDGTYEIRLSAFAPATPGTAPRLVASTNITVIVGDGGVVPEATTLLMWGGLATCGSIFAWRKNKARA